MRWRPIFLALIIVLVSLPVAAWLTIPWWLPVLAEKQLAGYGFALKAMQIEQIGWHKASLKQLHIRQIDGGLEINARSIDAGYEPGRLLHGQLNSLEIDRLLLKLHPSGQQDGGGLALFAPAGLIASIPITHMQIGEISIRRLDSQGRLVQLLVGQASLEEKALSVAFRDPASDRALQAQLNLDREGRLQAGLIHEGESVVSLAGLISETEERIAVESEMHIELAALDRLARDWIDIPEFRLQGVLDGRWRASLPAHRELGPDEIGSELNASSSFTLNAKAVMADTADNISLQLDGEIGYDKGKGNWQLADASLLQLGEGKTGLQLKPTKLSGNFERHDALWKIGVNQGAGVTAGRLQMGDVSLARASLSLTKPLGLSLAKGGSLQLASPATMAVNVPEIRSGKNRLAANGIRLAINSGPLALPRGRFVVARLRLVTEAAKLPEAKLGGSFDLSQKVLAASGKLTSLDGNILLDWQLNHRPDRRLGKLSYTVQPLRFGAGGLEIAGFIDTLDAYELQAGNISGRGETSWRPDRGKRTLQLNHQLNLELASLAGFYQTNTFSGLSGKLQIAVNDSAIKLTSNDLAIGEFNVGIPIRNLTMQTTASLPSAGEPKVSVERLHGEALGGIISGERIDIDLARDSNPFVIRLEELDAGQIAEIRKQEGLYAEGTLDGVLPLDWTRDGLRITKGQLQARNPGGVIRYLGTESVQSLALTDKTTQMALNILSDLRYRQLQVGIDAAPDGEMTLRIELKGHNPGYENGRPIEFNLNIEENVLKLLYSLRMADEIGGRLEKQMQKKLRKR